MSGHDIAATVLFGMSGGVVGSLIMLGIVAAIKQRYFWWK